MLQISSEGAYLENMDVQLTARDNATMIENAKKTLAASTNLVDKVRLTCVSRGVLGIRSLGRMFKIMDDNGDKKLDKYEFGKGFREFGCELTKEEVAELFTIFDRNGSGFVDFEDMLCTLRQPMRQCRKDLVLKAFQKFDKDNTGKITISDLRGVYTAKYHPKFISGKMTEDEVFGEFLQTFTQSTKPVKEVKWEEFFNYYHGISCSIDLDVYFDVMMRQAWKL